MVDFQSRDTRRGPATDDDADDDSESGPDGASAEDDAPGTADTAEETAERDEPEPVTDAGSSDHPLTEASDSADDETADHDPVAMDPLAATEPADKRTDTEEPVATEDAEPVPAADAEEGVPADNDESNPAGAADFVTIDGEEPVSAADTEETVPADETESNPADTEETVPADETESNPADTEETVPADETELNPADTEETVPAADATRAVTDDGREQAETEVTPPASKTATSTRSIDVAVVTVAGDRAALEDTVTTAFKAAGHAVVRCARPDSGYDSLQQQVDALVGDSAVDIVVTVGGVGLAADELAIEAVHPLLEKALPGFGEAFRDRLADHIGTGIVGVRSTAGLCDGTFVFCLPGDAEAAELAVSEILAIEAPRLVSDLES